MEHTFEALFFDVVEIVHDGKAEYPLIIASFEEEDDAIEWAAQHERDIVATGRDPHGFLTFEIRKRYKEQS